MSELPTVRNQPHLFLKNRAERLFRLVELNAPAIVVHGQLKGIEEALASMYAWLSADYEKTDGDEN